MGWALNPVTDVLMGRGRNTHREDIYVKTERNIGVMQEQAKEWQGLPGGFKSEEETRKEGFTPSPFREIVAFLILDFHLPELGENTFYCFKSPSVG